jgi:DNA-binding PadR family transcriptional regulator
MLRSKWGFSENNRRAKYYTLTPAGRRALERQAESWGRVSDAIARVMRSE